MGLPSSVENDARSGWESVKHAAGDVEQASETAWNDAVAAAKQAGRQLSDPNSLTSQLGHTALDTIGMVPLGGSVAEAANAGWYAAQGDYANAALSGASAIPVIGDAADAARLTKDGIGIARDGGTIARDVHGAEKIAKDADEGEAARPHAPAAKPPDPVRVGGGGGDAGGPPRAPDSPDGEYPIGLAYRRDLPQHLAGPDGFRSDGKLNGTHNLDNAKSALESRGAYPVEVLEKGKPGYMVTPTGTHGVSELHYQVRNPTSRMLKHDAKTVYDPAVHSDQSMLQAALKVGEKAFSQYRSDPSMRRFDVTQDGIKFRAHINFDRRTGAPYVGSVRPMK
jgi:hypothetical protein